MTACQHCDPAGALNVICITPRTAETLALEALLAGGIALSAVLALMLQALPSLDAYLRTALCLAAGAIILGGVLLPWLSGLIETNALSWLVNFFTLPGRPTLIAYWTCIIPSTCMFAAAVRGRNVKSSGDASTVAEDPTTQQRKRLLLARKVYHLAAVGLFVPGVLYQQALLQIAFAGVLPTFLVLEVVRVQKLPPLAKPLSGFLGAFIDSRDAGTLILTHVYLLLGCAIPVWLDAALPHALGTRPAVMGAAAQISAAARAAVPYAGILVLGVGDAMASTVGICAGRIRWPGRRKTLEGSAAGVASMLLTLVLIQALDNGGKPYGPGSWAALGLCTTLACALEATTEQIDNLFLPLYYATLLLSVAAASKSFETATVR